MFYRGYWNSAVWLLLVSGLVLAIGLPRGAAGDYLFDLPQLLGTYSGSGTSVQVSTNLGLPFNEIDRASLIFTGTLSTGSYTILDEEGIYPLTARVQAWYDGTDSSTRLRLENNLPTVEGEFEFRHDFAAASFGSAPDFRSWLSGSAEFDFVVGLPLMFQITQTESLPEVTITSAQLLIAGQPDLGSLVIDTDFDIDGDVDLSDLARWQAAYNFDPTADSDGDGDSDGLDFLAWQRSFGYSLDAIAVMVPEPGNASMVLLALAIFTGKRAIGRPK